MTATTNDKYLEDYMTDGTPYAAVAIDKETPINPYVCAYVVEGVIGYYPIWNNWGETYEDAVAHAKVINENLGLSQDQVDVLIGKSMSS